MNKLVAVWGSPSAGKSTVSIALAWELAKRKQNVLVLNADNTVPNLPVYLPSYKGGDASIGSVLENSIDSQKVLQGKIHLHPQSGNIGFMAYESGETPLSYKSFEKGKIYSLLKLLQTYPVDYTIIDCQSNPMHNILTLSALESADFVLRLLTPDVKGIEFNKTHSLWLSKSININVDKHVKVASPCRQYSALDEVNAVVGGFDIVLPDNSETYINFTCGNKFSYSSAAARDFEKGISEIAERISVQNEPQ